MLEPSFGSLRSLPLWGFLLPQRLPGASRGEGHPTPLGGTPAVVQAAASTSTLIQQRRNRDEPPAVILAPSINAP